MRKYIFLALVLSGLALASHTLTAQSQTSGSSDNAKLIDGIPGPMSWQNPPAHWKIDNRQTLTIDADKKTDWFISPIDGSRREGTPRLLFKAADDFVLSAKVTVDFHTTWDSGALVLVEGDSVWAKFCFEMTVDKQPSIVSVVTKDVSDDNNSIAISGKEVYLKVAKVGRAIFFYASEDGQKWMIIRSFSLGKTPDLRIGFASQSPVGEGCRTVFSDIRYEARTVNLWTGK